MAYFNTESRSFLEGLREIIKNLCPVNLNLLQYLEGFT